MGFKIDPNKILNYLPSDRTETSAGKNRFLRHAGFRPEEWAVLERALLQHPLTATLESVDMSSPYGRKFVYRCLMPPAPNRRSYCIRTVWQERDGVRWLLTAFPQPVSGAD